MSTKPKLKGAKPPPDGGRFAKALGQFLMNCGALEFYSYTWLLALLPDFKLASDISGLSWSDRIGRIESNLKRRRLPKSLRSEVTSAWNDVRRVANLRNIVAHGPMFWATNLDGTLMGIVPNVKHALRGRPAHIVQYDDICEAVPVTGELYHRLKGLLDRVGDDLGIQVPGVAPDSQQEA